MSQKLKTETYKEPTDAISKSKIKGKKMQENKFINKINLTNLYRQIKHIITKLEEYISLEETSKQPYIFLNHNLAKLFGDSFLINILNIAEILELNKNYVPKIRRLSKLSEVSQQPLVIGYVIANYMKHSYKPYLPTTVDYDKLDGQVLYDFTFDQYIQDVVGANDDYGKELVKKGQFQQDGEKQRKEAFKKIYLMGYDYLYVRFFGQEQEVIDILSKVNNKLELNDQETKLAIKYQASRARKLKRMLSFFKFMASHEKEDKERKLEATFLYKNANELGNIFKEKK